MTATLIAYGLMAAGGLALTLGLLAVVSLAVAMVGQTLWRRLRRVYRLATIHHYLAQLEKTGRYHFPPPDLNNP